MDIRLLISTKMVPRVRLSKYKTWKTPAVSTSGHDSDWNCHTLWVDVTKGLKRLRTKHRILQWLQTLQHMEIK